MHITKAALAGLLILLVSCSSKSNIAAKLWSESRNFFESGQVNTAVKAAEYLQYYDANGSKFLIGQYIIYNGMLHGGAFPKSEGRLKELMDIDADNTSTYKGDYLAARVFAHIHMKGNDDASILLSRECKKWKSINSEQCAKYLIADSVERYMATPDHLDAVYVYESARIGGQLKLVDAPDSEFYEALSLVNNDNNYANELIKSLNANSKLNINMRKIYCKLITYVKVDNEAIDCHAKTGSDGVKVI